MGKGVTAISGSRARPLVLAGCLRCPHELFDRGPFLGRSSALAKNKPGSCPQISFCRALRSGTDGDNGRQ